MRLAGSLGAMALVLAVPVSAAAAEDAKSKRCARGQASLVRVGKRVVVGKPTSRRPLVRCVRVARPPRTALGFRRAQLRLTARPPFPSRRARGFQRRPLVRRVGRFESALLRGVVRKSAGARASRETHTTTTNDGPLGSRAPRGARQFTRVTRTEPDPDERGGYQESESGFDGVSVKGEDGTGGLAIGMGTGYFVKRCPDPNGFVRGEFRERFVKRASLDSAQGRGQMTIVQTTEADFVGHVGDDARVQDYDYRGFSTLEVRLAIDGRQFPSTTRTAFWREGVDPRVHFSGGTDAEFIASLGNLRFSIFGPKGRIAGDNPMFANLFQDLIMKTGWLEDTVGRALLDDEDHWYEQFECVDVELTADRASVERGGKAELDAVARLKADRSEIETASFSASATGGQRSAVTPASAAGSPAHFTLSDIGEWHPEPYNSPGIEVIATSRRGRGVAGKPFPVKGAPVPLFDVEVSFTGHQDCAGGGTAPLDDMTMSGSVDRRDPEFEDQSIGSGTATGTARHYPDGSDCTSGLIQNSFTDTPVTFYGQYMDDGQLMVSWIPEEVPRWANIAWIVPGNGTYTTPIDSGERHFVWTMTVSNLHPLE